MKVLSRTSGQTKYLQTNNTEDKLETKLTYSLELQAQIRPPNVPHFDQNSPQNDFVGIDKPAVRPDQNFPDGSFSKIPHIQTGATEQLKFCPFIRIRGAFELPKFCSKRRAASFFRN